MEPKYSSSNGLRIARRHNIYPSWIIINLAGFFRKTSEKFLQVKCLTISLFTSRLIYLDLGTSKCFCGQAFKFESN